MALSRSVISKLLAFGMLLSTAANAAVLPHLAIRQPTPACSDGALVENLWVVDQLNVTYTHDEMVRPGTATWRVANTMTSTAEVLRCNLRANYICELIGTPEDPSLHVWLQINLDVARVSINQTLPCGDYGDSITAYAIGTAELYLTCNDATSEEDLTCQSDDSDGGTYAHGSVTVREGSL